MQLVYCTSWKCFLSFVLTNNSPVVTRDFLQVKVCLIQLLVIKFAISHKLGVNMYFPELLRDGHLYHPLIHQNGAIAETKKM